MLHPVDLRALVLVGRTGSMSEAAERLGVPTSTLSRRVRRLERELRTPLVAADRTGSVVTAAGRRVVATAARMLALLDDALDGPPHGADAVDPRQVELLRLVTTVGSIRRAAARLGLPPQSLSRTVQRLEQHLGTPLLRRSPGGAVPTEAARRLLDAVAAAERLCVQLRRDLAAAAGAAPGRPLRFGHQSATLADLARAPGPDGVAMTAMKAGPEVSLPALADGALDLVQCYQVSADPVPVRAPLRSRIVLVEPCWVVLPDGHRLAGADVVDLAELADDEWVVQAPGSRTRDMVFAACRAAGFEPRVCGAANDAFTVEHYIRDAGCVTLGCPVNNPGDGWTMVPATRPVTRDLVLAWHPGRVPGHVVDGVTARVLDWYARAAATRNPRYAATLHLPDGRGAGAPEDAGAVVHQQ